MYFWEVVWRDKNYHTHSMYALRGELTALEANKKLLVMFPSICHSIQQRGGKVLDAQVVYKKSKRLYDQPDELIGGDL